MLFATDSLRKKLGLTYKQTSDPDVSAGRLVVADRYLENILYGGSSAAEQAIKVAKARSNIISKENTAWQIARDMYDEPTTTYITPDGRRIAGDIS